MPQAVEARYLKTPQKWRQATRMLGKQTGCLLWDLLVLCVHCEVTNWERWYAAFFKFIWSWNHGCLWDITKHLTELTLSVTQLGTD
jgi:hypothetical protein